MPMFCHTMNQTPARMMLNSMVQGYRYAAELKVGLRSPGHSDADESVKHHNQYHATSLNIPSPGVSLIV